MVVDGPQTVREVGGVDGHRGLQCCRGAQKLGLQLTVDGRGVLGGHGRQVALVDLDGQLDAALLHDFLKVDYVLVCFL